MKHIINNCTTISSSNYSKPKHQPIVQQQKHLTFVSPILPKTNPTNTSNAILLGSLSTSTITTTTSQLKSTSSKCSIAKNTPFLNITKPIDENENISHITNQTNSLLSKSYKQNLQIYTHDNITNSELNDTHLEEILEIEGKKIMNKLSNTFKLTTQGNFVINTKMYLHTTKQQLNSKNKNDNNENDNEIKERDFISSLITSRCQGTHMSTSRKEKRHRKIHQLKSNEDITSNTLQQLKDKLTYIDSSSMINSTSKDISHISNNTKSNCKHMTLCNNKKHSIDKKVKSLHRNTKSNTIYNKGDNKNNNEDIMNFLIQSTYEKTKTNKKGQHNKIKSHHVLSSSRGKVLKQASSKKSIHSTKKIKNI